MRTRVRAHRELVTPRPRGRIVDPKYPKAKKAPLPGITCHATIGARIMSFLAAARRLGNKPLLSPPQRSSGPSPTLTYFDCFCWLVLKAPVAEGLGQDRLRADPVVLSLWRTLGLA
jgi:hypothetical protein